MRKILLYPLSAIYYFTFGLLLLIFHLLQWLGLKLFGYRGHKAMVDLMNFFLLNTLYLLGSHNRFENEHQLPRDRPLIIVANHQSMFDIVAIGWYLRRQHPKFISKIELGSGIPSVSFNLTHGGSVCIDRKDPRQSIPALHKFAKRVNSNNWAAVIFPEGTRSRTGEPKNFSTTGLKVLLKNLPDALVVPLTINNSWKIQRFGSFPLDGGLTLGLKVQQPLAANSLPPEELIAAVEHSIKKDITQP